MKVICLLLLALSGSCFAQKLQTLNDGEFQFINADYGIVVKKDAKLYAWIPQPILFSENFAAQLFEIDAKLISKIIDSDENIYPEHIKKYNFKKLKKLKFVTEYESNPKEKIIQEYHLSQYNNEYFAMLDVYENGFFSMISHYTIVDLGNNRKILVITDSNFKTLIIPTKEKLIINHQRFALNVPGQFNGNNRPRNNAFDTYTIQKIRLQQRKKNQLQKTSHRSSDTIFIRPIR